MNFEQWATPYCKKTGVNINAISVHMANRLSSKLSEHILQIPKEIIVECSMQWLTKETGVGGTCPNCGAPAFGNEFIFKYGTIYHWKAFVCSGSCGSVLIQSVTG
jgi:hypothetical protein